MKKMIYYTEHRRDVLATGYCFDLLYFILNLGFHPTAYIKIPDDMKVSDEDVDVHGGITYSSNHLWISDNDRIEGKFIGWDYAHYGDYLGFEELPEIKKIHEKFKNIGKPQKKWTTEEIYKEVKKACYQIRKIEEAEEEEKDGNKNKI